MDANAFVDFFRQASPYINAHRGKTFVICFGGEALTDRGQIDVIHDIALLNSLGIKLVLIHGAEPQIDARLRQAGIDPGATEPQLEALVSSSTGVRHRVTDEAALPFFKEAIGQTRFQIEALLSMGLANSPMYGARIRVASGNCVTARPLGVRSGVDFGFSGTVRRVDQLAIKRWLDSGAIVLLSPLGYSPTGEAFNLNAEEVATETALALRADKLLLLYEGEDLRVADASRSLVRQLTVGAAAEWLSDQTRLPGAIARHLEQALRACNGGVRRVHLLRRDLDGVLLQELFTRDGIGTLVAADTYEDLRAAVIDDVGGVLEVIRPLEAAGILVRRSRELLEVEIERFSVLERDGAIIGCAALYPFPDEQLGELACLAVTADYRNSGRAELLLKFIERQAQKRGLSRLFVLTTQTAHWFRERGFVAADLSELPLAKRDLYNIQRRSKVFIKSLSGDS